MRLHHSHPSKARSGITLTEILISIMILGIGMVSVATLFPIGLMRLRDATRDARSTILAQSAMNDADVRGLPRALGDAKGLVNADSFVHPNLPWYAPWRNLSVASPGFSITPLTHDLNVNAAGAVDLAGNPGVFSQFFSPGLPVAYDPLFWATTHFATEGLAQEHTPLGLRGQLGSEARFGSGLGFIRNSPDGSQPSAHGMQRLTNFEAYQALVPWPYTYSLPSTPAGFEAIAEVAGKVFTSLDDPVVVDDESGQSSSPLVPVNYGVAPDFISERKYEFSWMVTGRLGVAGDPSNFEGNIVIFHGRPIGLDPAPSGLDPSVNVLVPSDERVVEAIWGYTNTASAIDPSRVVGVPGGYSSADDRTVMLRWPISSRDPLLRVGDFIADVTYERYQNTASAHYPNNYPAAGVPYSGQRIHWYRIVQKGGVEPDPTAPGFLRSIIRVDTPLQAKTRLINNAGVVDAAVREVALICPYVVNVFPITLYSR